MCVMQFLDACTRIRKKGTVAIQRYVHAVALARTQSVAGDGSNWSRTGKALLDVDEQKDPISYLPEQLK
jgi:hypothetical protein